MAEKRRNVPAVQANLLWAASGNRCAYLDCGAELITFDGDRRVNIGEIAHIHAQNPGGARYRADLSEAEVDSFENCMIMCRKHHKFIDSNEDRYPAELLRAWKASHDEKYAPGASPAVARAHLGAPPPPVHPFVERTEIVEQLQAALARKGRVSLVGISGSGKSQMALSLLNEDHGEYTFRWWVRAASPELFESDVAAIGVYVGVVPHEKENLRDIALRVRAALEKIPGWLMVVDDAHAALDSSLLPVGTGHIILTTQNSAASSLWEAVGIPALDNVQSRALLRDLAPTVDASDSELDQIAGLCSGLPLAVAQVGSYLASTHSPISDYIEIVRARRAELMARGSGGTHATLDVTISGSIGGLHDGSRQLLDILSIFAPEPIDLNPGDFSNLPLDANADLSDPLTFEDAIAGLRALSLIERSGNTVATHQLVQAVVRRHLEDERASRAVLGAAGAILNQLPSRAEVPTQWPRMELLLPHINAVVGRLAELSIASVTAAFLLNRAGLYHRSRGSIELAHDFYTRGLSFLDGDSSDSDGLAMRGTFLNNLGNLQLDRGDFTEAEETLRESLRYKQMADASSEIVGIAFAALASALHEQGRNDEAQGYHLEALRIYREAGADARVADCLCDLAQLAVEQLDYEAASSYINDAVTIAQRDEESWPELSSAFLIRAGLHEEREEFVQAIKSARQAARVAQRAVNSSLQLARALGTQGRLLARVIDLKAGIAILEKAHAMFVDLGEASPVDISRVKGNLGHALAVQGIDVERGVALLLESLEIAANVLPAGHRTTQMSTVMLADGLTISGDYVGALELLQSLREQSVSDDIAALTFDVLQKLSVSALLANSAEVARVASWESVNLKRPASSDPS